MAKNEATATCEIGSSTINHRSTQVEVAVRAHEIFLERGSIPVTIWTTGNKLNWNLLRNEPMEYQRRRR
jgi:hypothetical protein